jgi:hypothetical protein
MAEPAHERPHSHDHGHDDGHGHGAGHSHEHPHGSVPRAEPRHVPMRGAVLDIGGDVGAVLVRTGPALAGAEIELYDEQGGYLMHTEVHAREVPGGTQYAGLFPAVGHGSYLLDTRDGSPRERVVVVGGEVATVSRVAETAEVAQQLATAAG